MKGECLMDSWNWIMDNPDKKRYRIIHAEVERPSDGFRHPHSVVYDTKTNEIINIDPFVKVNFMDWIFKGKVSKVKQFEFYEITDLMLKHRQLTFFKHPEYCVLVPTKKCKKYVMKRLLQDTVKS